MDTEGIFSETSPPLPQGTRTSLRHLAENILRLGIRNYLASPDFLRFCRDHRVDDVWGGLMSLYRDQPELYGGDTIRRAFFVLLQHVYRSRNAEFLPILSELLTDYAGTPLNPSFFLSILQDLLKLGYTKKDVETAFSIIPGPAGVSGMI